MDYCGNAKAHEDELFVSFEEAQAHVEKACDYLAGAGCRFSLFEMPLCATGRKYQSRHADSESSRLNLFANNDVGENLAIPRCSTDHAECKGCKAKPRCAGVWPSAYEIGGPSLLRPFREGDDA